MDEFPCTCTGLDAELKRKCLGCRANAALEAETRRVVEIVLNLQKCSSCKTVKKTCQVILDRILVDQ